MTIIGATLAFLFLDGAARYTVIGLLLLVDAFEIAVWLRWRKRRSGTGPEGLIDAVAEVIADCAPDGQVKLKGQIWSARCAVGTERGTAVRVIAVDGLRLHVEPVDAPARPTARLQRASGRSRSSA